MSSDDPNFGKFQNRIRQAVYRWRMESGLMGTFFNHQFWGFPNFCEVSPGQFWSLWPKNSVCKTRFRHQKHIFCIQCTNMSIRLWSQWPDLQKMNKSCLEPYSLSTTAQKCIYILSSYLKVWEWMGGWPCVPLETWLKCRLFGTITISVLKLRSFQFCWNFPRTYGELRRKFRGTYQPWF
jgi:hypothetical protein